ncbi:hypothetical protein GCM10023153_33800 [Ornithinibacter aureus]|uniref:Uncharacterized protein n=1 Tax=Ornithinibacter aureus TaxID=622664 RepID=A0ABP8KBG7_9MICO
MYSDADLLVAAFLAAVGDTKGRVVAACDRLVQAHGAAMSDAVAPVALPVTARLGRVLAQQAADHDPDMTGATPPHPAQREASDVLDCCNARRPPRTATTQTRAS